jgi:L-ascorbate metabolism protein UlaG (beta-lactamase superfamily)
MKLHHIRNATFVIEAGNKIILVDPMLGKIGTQPPFTLFRYKPKRNPLVALPTNSQTILDSVTHCLVTHLHPDHLDQDAETFLKSKNIPVICSSKDEKTLKKRGLNVSQSLDYWKPQAFLGGEITGIPAVHGYGFIAFPMGNVMGFYIKLNNEESIYISADTVYTEHVEKVLSQLKPDITVIACGTARLDIGKPLLMTMEEILKFVEKSPKKVFANHLEALNHCPTTRQELKMALKAKGLLGKVAIPNDGETVMF